MEVLMRLLSLLLLFLLVSCKPFRSAEFPSVYPDSLFSSGGSDRVPETDKLSPGCLSDPAFDACLSQKNPVAQTDQPLLNSWKESLYYGVKIRSLDRSGFLKNGWLSVESSRSARVHISNLSKWKSGPSVDESQWEELSAYYWTTRTMEYLTARLGAGFLKLSELRVFVDEEFTGYISKHKMIALNKGANVPHAAQADVVIQLLGQAIADQNTAESVFGPVVSSERFRCPSDAGCSRALASAAGDYLVGIMFPDSPRIGESLQYPTGDVNGQSACGLKRDLLALQSLTAPDVYLACRSQEGLAAVLGSWYASLWWKIRTEAEAQVTGASQDIDTLFFLHLKRWKSSSNWATAKQDAVAASDLYKSGKYTQLILSTLSAAQIQ
jgi:hypothetical protein